MFGQNKTPFGGFGTATNTGFGTPTAFGVQTPTSGGLFSNTNTSTSNVFGNTTTFGQQPQPTSGFSFGQQTNQQQTGGLFGQNAATSGGLFGTPNTGSAFGSKPNTTFGTATTFGNTTGGGLFGNNQQQPSTGLFGSNTAANTTGGLFGGFGQTNTASGTIVKFNPPTGSDTMLKNGVSNTINTRHQCITAMKEYENKSLEELRTEDYLANRKGKQAGTGLFGATTATAQPTGFGGFTQKPQAAGFNTTFGTSTAGGGLFGQTQTQPATGGLFGASKPGGLFGPTVTTASSTPAIGFGANTGVSLFGQQQKPSLFGAPASSGGLFGSTNPATTGFGSTGFGATTGFGNTAATGGLFGANKPGFGAATTSGGFTFSQPPPSGGLFSKPATTSTGFSLGLNTNSFGTTNSGGLFGSKPTGFGTTGFGTGTGFGTAVSSTGGFGTAGSSLFSGAANKPAIGFGGFNTGGATGFTGFNTTNTGLNNLNTGTATAYGQMAVNSQNAEHAALQQQLTALSYSPYGDSPLFRNMKDNIKPEEKLKPTNPAAQKAALSNAYKVSPHQVLRARAKPRSAAGSGKSSLFDGLDEEELQLGNDTFVPRKSVKKLVIQKHCPSRENSLLLGPDSSRFEDLDSSRNGLSRDNRLHNGDINSRRSLTPDNHPKQNLFNRNDLDDTIAILNPSARGKGLVNESANSTLHDSDINLPDTREDTPPIHPAGVILRRPGYFTIPSLEQVADMIDSNGECLVDDITIGREGYGSVYFPGVTNITGLNLDEIVHFRRKEITVYPDDDKKPAVGVELNKCAEVTLDCVWPVDKSDQSVIKCPIRLRSMNYAAKIERATAKIGAKFIDYRPETGSWVFEVKHFSKYGLLDDDEEEDVDQPLETDPKKLKLIKQATEKQLKIQKKQINVTEVLGDVIVDDLMPSDVQEMVEQETRQLEQPMQEEDDSDDDIDNDDDDEDMADITREPMPRFIHDDDDDDIAGPPPASHILANSLGLSASNVQMMKASFFGDDEMEDAIAPKAHRPSLSLLDKLRPISPVVKQLDMASSGATSRLGASLLRRPSPTQKTASPQPRLKAARESLLKPSMPSGLLTKLRPSSPYQRDISLTDHILVPSRMEFEKPPQRVRIKRDVVPLEHSLINKRHKSVMDAACYMGKTCRVGWGPKWTISHCGKEIGKRAAAPVHTLPAIIPSHQHQKSQHVMSPYIVSLEKVHVAPSLDSDDETLLKNYTMPLEIKLEHSEFTEIGNGCPKVMPVMGVQCLHKYAENLLEETDMGDHHDASNVQHWKLVWQLCEALWGELDEFKGDVNFDTSSYRYHMARREALSRWLEMASVNKIKDEVQEIKFKGDKHISAVLSYLTGRQIQKACNLSTKSRDYRIALLISQTLSSHVYKQMVRKQLANWNEIEADKFIDTERMKVYSLLAGCAMWPTSSKTMVNVCENLDWKRCLALHLWYICSPNAMIPDVLEDYDKGFKGRSDFGSYCCSPYPPYLEDNCELIEETPDDRRSVVYDTCYHLLKLYCQRSHRLERILAPTTSTANHLDYRLSWHLLQILLSLGYSHISEFHLSSIHANFISQLETVGLWQWAVFVALHYNDPVRREKVVRDLLNRHISVYRTEDSTRKEQFLREKLHIPATLLHEAKALHAQSMNMHHEEAWHLLKAHHWNRSHSILIKYIAPDCIITDNTEYLMKFLTELSDNNKLIQGWSTAGQVYYDFIKISNSLQKLRQQSEPSVYELEALQPEVTSLCNRINSLPCSSANDRMCQAEMAKKTANLMRVLLGLQSQTNNPDGNVYVSARLLAPSVTKLPLPEDYALQELRIFTRNYVSEMTS